MRNNSFNTNSRCEVRVYHYKNQILGEGTLSDSELLDCEVIDISSADNVIMAFSYEKMISVASGVFSLILLPSKNWLQVVRPGDWIAISLSQKGTSDKEVRCLGIIDRVAQTEVVQPDGIRAVTYNISGRDYGKVFESYMVYFEQYDPNAATQKVLLGEAGVLSLVGRSNESISELIRVFLGGAIESATGTKTQLDAFRIPSQLSKDFGGNGSNKFADILKIKLDDIPGTKTIRGDFLQDGTLWDTMLLYSNNLVNELYVEHTRSDGEIIDTPDDNRLVARLFDKPLVLPTLTLRIYPFTNKDFEVPSPFDGVARTFQSLETVEITGDDIFNSNIGISDRDMLNYILLYPDIMAANGAAPGIAQLINSSPKFPFLNLGLIRRHGLRMYRHGMSFVDIGTGSNPPEIIHGWNILAKHWFLENHNLETGTIMIVGKTDMRVGKRLVINNAKLNNNKEFYIEAVSDEWSYPGQWTQTLQLTRGKSFDGLDSELTFKKLNSQSNMSGQSTQSMGRK